MPPVAMTSKDDLSYKSSQSNAAFFHIVVTRTHSMCQTLVYRDLICISGKRSWKNYSKQRLAKCQNTKTGEDLFLIYFYRVTIYVHKVKACQSILRMETKGRKVKEKKETSLLNKQILCCPASVLLQRRQNVEESVPLICFFFFFQFCFFRVKELETDVENKDDKLSELQKR